MMKRNGILLAGKNTILIMTALSVMAFAEFTRANQIVTDSTTGLQWQDNDEAKTIEKTWTEAIDYCQSLDFGTHTDWRLPNFNELYYIADRSKSNPAIDDTFQNVVSDNYWSSSTIVSDTSPAWVVGFNYGNDNHRFTKTTELFVRCVRDGQ